MPKLDLELYIQNYKGKGSRLPRLQRFSNPMSWSGRTRFDRLFLIGRSSVTLCVDALKAAIAEAKRGRDLQRYRDAVECLRLAAPSEPETTYDRQWMEATEKSNRAEIVRLEAELKGYKNNLIKESVRVGLVPSSIVSPNPDKSNSFSPGRWVMKTSESTSKPREI